MKKPPSESTTADLNKRNEEKGSNHKENVSNKKVVNGKQDKSISTEKSVQEKEPTSGQTEEEEEEEEESNNYGNVPNAPRKMSQHCGSQNHLTHGCKRIVSESGLTICKSVPANAEYCDRFSYMICNRNLLTNCYEFRMKLCHEGA